MNVFLKYLNRFNKTKPTNYFFLLMYSTYKLCNIFENICSQYLENNPKRNKKKIVLPNVIL